MRWLSRSPGEDSFEQAFRAAVARNGLTLTAFSGDQAEFPGPDGQKFYLRFQNLRSVLNETDPARWAEVMDHFLATVVEATHPRAPPTLDDVRARLLPRVGPPSHFAELNTPRYTLVDGLLDVALVIDEPRTVSQVLNADYERWGATIDDLYQTALDNLRRTYNPKGWITAESLPGVQVFHIGDSHDASRALLLGEMVQPWPAKGVVACIPTREHLFVTRCQGMEVLPTITQMFIVAHNIYKEDRYPVTDQPLWYDGQEWEHLPMGVEEKKIHMSPKERFVKGVLGDGQQSG